MDYSTIDVIVPIYNMYVWDVPVLQVAIAAAQRCTVHICDNSEVESIKFANSEYCCEIDQVIYHDMGGNVGLSRAYNYALNSCSSDVVCIFDDDTEVDSCYFDIVIKQSNLLGSGVYVPAVFDGGRLLSPLKSFGPAIFKCKTLDAFDSESCFAFNTGMAVTRDIFSLISYDESLFIEWIDHAFCRAAHRYGIQFSLLPGVRLQQNYSRKTNDIDAALHREALAGPDLRVYYSGSIINRIYGYLYRFYRVLLSCIRYRTIKFFTCF